MPSSWSSSLRFEMQFSGENINLWGDKLNAVLAHADYAISGFLPKALTNPTTTLTTANAADDEARAAMVKFTGAGAFTVIIPSVSKSYLVWNACSGTVMITTGAGVTVTIDPGDIVNVFSDAIGVRTPGYSGLSIKDYIAAQTASAGAVPGVVGNAGKYLFTDGASAFWRQAQTGDIADFATASTSIAAALAIVLGRRR